MADLSGPQADAAQELGALMPRLHDALRQGQKGAFVSPEQAELFRHAARCLHHLAGGHTAPSAPPGADEQLLRLNRELQLRTEQLEAANKELEAFSYSVSHDLRAPLRHISGFVDLLIKGSAATLDEAGRRYARIISESARLAGRLVDELLNFSRMGRVELRQSLLDMNRLAEVARAEAEQEAAPGQRIEWDIRPLPPVRGDSPLLHLALRNLLSNAVKYTRDRDPATIRLDATTNSPSEEVVYCVRDNGVGFDMAYADKLFGVFQRLHTQDQFDGIGIGLANVRRIVARHGGRVWAEGQLGQGAAFYFSLPGD